MTKPTKFEDLKPTELYRSAIEDFAIDVEESDKNKKSVLLAAFVESGVTWADYVAQHPEVAPDPEPEAPKNVVTSSDVAPVEDAAVAAEKAEEPNIIVAQTPKANSNDVFLIRMVRDNVLFETRGHRFTQAHPYALVSPDDAEYILTQEDGFRQATPGELAEFYS